MNAPWTTIVAPPTVPATADADELALKDRYAEALLRMPNDPYRAACAVFGNDTIRALKVSQQWTYDFYVLQRQTELLGKFGDDEYLPTKAEVARRIYTVGETATDNKDKLAAFKLYAELRGFVPKGDAAVNLTVNNNRVMIVKDFGTNDDWETKAAAQQTKLIEHSRD